MHHPPVLQFFYLLARMPSSLPYIRCLLLSEPNYHVHRLLERDSERIAYLLVNRQVIRRLELLLSHFHRLRDELRETKSARRSATGAVQIRAPSFFLFCRTIAT